MSTSAPLHQAGSVEWVAAVLTLATAGNEFVCCKPLADDLRVRPHCPNGLDCDVVFVVNEQGLFSIPLSSYDSFVC